MWRSETTSLQDGRVRKIAVTKDGERLRYSNAIQLWQKDESFRSFFMSILNDAPFGAYRWETPPITSATAGQEFEFVLVDSPGLERTVDQTAFAKYFDAAREGEMIVAFSNLGKDAYLVVPCPCGPTSAYGHLASFTREAPESQQHEIWQTVGRSMQQQQLGTKPIWLSTAGMGVSWLHIRLDSRPKYYSFRPYAEAA